MNLKNFFDEHPKAALAFSRSAESAYLLYEALKCGADIPPYFVNTQFHSRFEEENTRRLCAQMGGYSSVQSNQTSCPWLRLPPSMSLQIMVSVEFLIQERVPNPVLQFAEEV